MQYFIDAAAFSAVFTVPCTVVDDRIKLATRTQLQVILYVLRNMAAGIDVQKIASDLGAEPSQVEDALLFWSQAGLLRREEPAATALMPKAVVRQDAKPSREDVARRGLEDKKVRFLLQEAQVRFGRALKSNEAALLVWMYDDLGLAVSVILLLLQYATSQGRLHLSFLERTAAEWAANGVVTIADAERQIETALRQKTAWRLVEKTFGIESRNPSAKERAWADLWLNEWQLSTELLRAAYDACVDAKTKLSMPYVAKILDRWHQDGITRPQDLAKAPAKPASRDKNYGSYDLKAFERMLDEEG